MVVVCYLGFVLVRGNEAVWWLVGGRLHVHYLGAEWEVWEDGRGRVMKWRWAGMEAVGYGEGRNYVCSGVWY